MSLTYQVSSIEKEFYTAINDLYNTGNFNIVKCSTHSWVDAFIILSSSKENENILMYHLHIMYQQLGEEEFRSKLKVLRDLINMCST